MSDLGPQLRPLILSIGSDMFRLGWAGNDFPDIIAPSVYVDITDNLFKTDVIDGFEDIFIKEEQINKHLFGRDALKYQNILELRSFWEENNYNVLIKYFYHYYNQLKIAEENQLRQPIVILTPFFMTEMEKQKLQKVFFDFFHFPSILFLSESQAILSALQKSSGVIVNIGENHTFISTIFHGFTNIMARDVFPIAGKELTNYFFNLILTEKGVGKNLFIDKWLAKEIKEKTAICVPNPEEEIKRIKGGLSKYNQPITFPDGTNLTINAERFMLVEPLFNPIKIHIDYMGLPEAIAKVIKSWERENWEELVPNIILSGGSSLISGLKERLLAEIKPLFSERLQEMVNVIALSGRENMGWIGASVLYTKEQMQKGWVHNPEYQDSEEGSPLPQEE